MELDDQKSTQLLKELSNKIKQIIDAGLSKGDLKSEDEVWFKWKVDSFKYDDNGPGEHSATGDYIVKKSWFRAMIKIEGDIEKSTEYTTTLEYLTKIFGEGMNNFVLQRFTQKIISDYLYNQKFDGAVDELINKFFKSVKGEPLTYGAEVKLEGIILRPDKIEIAHGIILRKIAKEDLEKEYAYHSLAFSQTRNPIHTIPSAILRIEFLGTRVNEVQKKVGEAITILRLFRVGGVKFESYQLFSDSMTDLMASGGLFSGETTTANETYLIAQEDAKSLKKFWENVHPLVEKSLPWPGVTKEDHMTIAYKRYSDALLQNGLMERQITNTMMGLEGLLLKGDEKQELTYRLGIRVAKILGNLTHDPLEVKKIISDAYNVRSLFAHGGQLDYNARVKLENKYKSVKNLLLYVLDYLRICLIVYLTLHIEKDAFIDIIDKSFIDVKSNEQLTGILNPSKQILYS